VIDLAEGTKLRPDAGLGRRACIRSAVLEKVARGFTSGRGRGRATGHD
jgi:hypothetical protein